MWFFVNCFGGLRIPPVHVLCGIHLGLVAPCVLVGKDNMVSYGEDNMVSYGVDNMVSYGEDNMVSYMVWPQVNESMLLTC